MKWRDNRRFSGTIEVLQSSGKYLLTEVVFMMCENDKVGKTYLEVFDPLGRLVEHKILKVGRMTQEELETCLATF